MTKRRVSKAPSAQATPLLDEIHALIESARQRAAAAVNAELTMLYWRIGQRIRVHVLSNQRARYGEEILATLSQELTVRYGRGFSYVALTRMLRFNVMRDPYVLDFLGLQDTWAESDLEAAILREMEAFLLELGAGFSFVARQKRIQLDGEDFHLDLLFYNRKLRRLVAVELKVGDFKAAYKGQMELYLRWLDKFEREPDEEPPLGIILCAAAARIAGRTPAAGHRPRPAAHRTPRPQRTARARLTATQSPLVVETLKHDDAILDDLIQTA